MKKVLGVVAILSGIVLASCSVTEGTADLNAQASVTTTGLGTQMVKLVRADSFIHSKYGMSQHTRSFEIRIKNVAYNKTVNVYHKLANGNWTNLAAHYVKDAGAGYEIWELSTTYYNYTKYAPEFVVNYTVNGQTYWDNNNNADYSMADGDGVLLGTGIPVLQSSFYYYGGSAYIYLDIQNLAYDKNVEVIYTTDNWASSTTVNAAFQSGYYYGYSYTQSPNALGVERWQANAYTTDSDNFQYFIKYTVNGQSYYDNNYGENYKLF